MLTNLLTHLTCAKCAASSCSQACPVDKMMTRLRKVGQ